MKAFRSRAFDQKLYDARDSISKKAAIAFLLARGFNGVECPIETYLKYDLLAVKSDRQFRIEVQSLKSLEDYICPGGTGKIKVYERRYKAALANEFDAVLYLNCHEQNLIPTFAATITRTNLLSAIKGTARHSQTFGDAIDYYYWLSASECNLFSYVNDQWRKDLI